MKLPLVVLPALLLFPLALGAPLLHSLLRVWHFCPCLGEGGDKLFPVHIFLNQVPLQGGS